MLYRPQCRECGASLGAVSTPELALSAWNRRADPADVVALRAENARLREILETIATAVPTDRTIIPWTHEAAADCYWAAFDRGRMLARAALRSPADGV